MTALEITTHVRDRRADLAALLRLWRRRSRTRRQLMNLDARGLADVGLTEAARRREAAKRFWQA